MTERSRPRRNDDQKRALVDALLACDALQFGEFELSHGGTSDYYVDTYRFETDPRALRTVADAFADRSAVTDPDATLAGVALGAVPLVTATALAGDRPYVIVRKDRKEYGTGNRVEGDLETGERVVVIEDVTTTGTSAAEAVEALRDAGSVVERVLVVVDRLEGAGDTLEDLGVELDALLTAEDLLRAADGA